MSDDAETSTVSGAGVPASEAPRPHGLLILLVSVVVVAALYFAKTVLIPITLAVLLSFVLGPVVALLRRLHLPKVAAVLLAVLLALLVILLLGGVIGMQIADLAGSLPRYQATFMHKFDAVQGAITQHLQALMSHFGRMAEGFPGHHAGGPAAPPAPAASGNDNSQLVTLAPEQRPPSTLSLLQTFLAPVVAPIETVGIVIVFAIFFLLQKEDLRDRLIRLFGSSDLHRTTAAIDDAGDRLSRYFLAQTGINAGFGVVICAGLTFLGLPNPILWGVLAMLMRFVPYIGAPISALLPIALAAAIDPHWGLAISTLVLFLVAEGITGQIVEPMTYGSTTGLSPVAVLVVAVFWGWIWGPIGLILSTPLTLCLVVLGRHVKRLEFFDVLLGDRPALTPVETFYQRILAHDPDEVQEQAEQLLNTRSLTAYYDGVARKGLELAASDIVRGALTPVQIARLREDIQTLIAELDDYDDVDPPHRLLARDVPVAGIERPDRIIVKEPAPDVEVAPQGGAFATPPLVLCVAGRGVLDDVPTTMLAQLLRKHGFKTRTVGHEEVSRAHIATLETAGVALICVTCLDLNGQPPHLRYLLRRLRQRLPEVPLLAGLWSADAEIFRDSDAAQMMAADAYAASLREMVIEAVEQVRVKA
ncbi:MAG TPA: AI-2E family transporter [Acidisoma sp.]|jgi:predicted PurR-regulated permease PerM|nr:AI-2E family transporter [Acidisoma sp.]